MSAGIEIGQACSEGDVCASKGVCIDGTCWCPPGYSLGEHGYCQPPEDLPASRSTNSPTTASTQVRVTITTADGRQPTETFVVDNNLPTTVRQSPVSSSGAMNQNHRISAGVMPVPNQHHKLPSGATLTPPRQQVKPTFPAFVLPPATPRPGVAGGPSGSTMPLGLGQQCTVNDICVQNAICYEGACHCRQGFLAYEGKCLPGKHIIVARELCAPQ